MNPKSISLVLAAGIATFVIVGIAVSELVQPWIEFSVFVGIPAGIVAGALAAALVATGLDRDAPLRNRRLAVSFGAFAATFLAVLVVGSLATLGVWLSIVVGAVVGLLVALGTYRRRPKSPRPGTSA